MQKHKPAGKAMAGLKNPKAGENHKGRDKTGGHIIQNTAPAVRQIL